jgi:basic amino acid/polyamine antiporter, APA family
VAFVRSIGRWAMTALIINCIIGSGIFGLPSELTRLVGRASPLAMLLGALVMAIIMACMAEVASQFSEAGGPYLYVRTTFGRFAALQVGWFWALAAVGGGAANANLFIGYLGGIWPWADKGWGRAAAMAVLIAVPTMANYRGARSGANLSSFLTVAKLLPLLLLIALGLTNLRQQPGFISASDVHAGWSAWLSALLLLIFPYGGYENALAPTGEVNEPSRTIPFALGAGLLCCAVVYALVQYVTVITIGAHQTDHPLAETASVLIGRGGAVFVAVAVMISTYGWISGNILNAPRIFYALAATGDAPARLAKLHPRFHTPSLAILIYAILVWALASTGSYLWVLALTAGSMMILYAGSCAALIRLRKLRPASPGFRAPFGRTLAIISVGISLLLLTRLRPQQVLLMVLTGLLATANWWWAKRRAIKSAIREPALASKT